MLFRVLGPLRVRDVAGRELSLRARKPRLLLAALLGGRGRRVSMDALVDAVWETTPPRSAVANLQTYVWELRRRLGHAGFVVERDHDGYVLPLDDVDVDAELFGTLASRGRAALAVGDVTKGAETLHSALRLCQGRPYEDVGSAVPFEVARLQELQAVVAEDMLDARLRMGEHRDVLDDLYRLTVDEPLRERPWELLMLALYRCGRRAEALRTYQQLYRILDRECGISPGQPVRELQQWMLREDRELGQAGDLRDSLPALA